MSLIIADNDFVPDVRLRTSCELTPGSVFGHSGCRRDRVASLYRMLCKCFQHRDVSAFYEIQYGRRPPSWICWNKLCDHPQGLINGGYLL